MLCQLEIPDEAVLAAWEACSGLFCLNAAPARPVDVDADLTVVNRYELEALARRDGLVAVTLGAEGAILLEDGEEIARAAPPPVEAVDGTAAGDAFTACLLVSLLEGREPRGGARAARVPPAPSRPRASARSRRCRPRTRSTRSCVDDVRLLQLVRSREPCPDGPSCCRCFAVLAPGRSRAPRTAMRLARAGAVSSSTVTTTPIILDCDPGHDDAIALLLALASPELELLGVTTTYGNQTLDKTTANALRVLELVGRTDVPVAAGADRAARARARRRGTRPRRERARRAGAAGARRRRRSPRTRSTSSRSASRARTAGHARCDRPADERRPVPRPHGRASIERIVLMGGCDRRREHDAGGGVQHLVRSGGGAARASTPGST